MDANASRHTSGASAAAVVAGVDGTAAAVRAAIWGASQARTRAVPLRLVRAVPATDRAAFQPGGIHHRDAQRSLDAAKELVEQHFPDESQRPEIRTEILRGRPDQVLVDCSRTAELLVLGSAEIGPLAHLMLGSTGLEVTRHAECPVALIRHADRVSGPVLIVVEDWASARPALLAGFAAAHARDGEAIVARVWHGRAWSEYTAWKERSPVVSDMQIEHCLRDYPDVRVRPVTVVGDTLADIETFSTIASLAVVTRDRSHEHPDRLGPISRVLVRHAPCPVLLMPDPNTPTHAEQAAPNEWVTR